MSEARRFCSVSVVIALSLAAVLFSPTAVAQTVAVSGQARAAALNIGGTTTLLADTGTLADINDAREAHQVIASIPPAFSGDVLDSATISWSDTVYSGTSLGDLSLTVGGTTISAEFVMAEALAALDTKSSGRSTINNLLINGSPITVTGAANQKVAFPGGYVLINEQKDSANRMTVNALHVIVSNIGNVVIGSATAGIN